MKFSVSSGLFSKQAQRVLGIVGSNNIIPIIDNFFLTLEGNKLTITTTDMETFMTTNLEVQGSRDGKICVSAKTLSDYLKAIPEQPISFEVGDQNGITIKRGKAIQKMVGEDAVNFPIIPELDDTESITVTSDFLFSALGKTVKSVWVADDSRPYMSGVNFNIKKESIDVVSTDANRLTLLTDNQKTEKECSFIIPTKPIYLILKNSDIALDDVTILYNKNNATLDLGDLHISVRLVDAKYPAYRQVIPTDNPYTAKVSKSEMINALRVSAISADKKTGQVNITATKNELIIESQDVNYGTESVENIQCEYDGKEIKIGMNSKMLLDMLSSINSEYFEMKLKAPDRAVVFHDLDDENFLGLVMPMMII